jgi:gamma-glutamyltranspeptidase/glutathione hydrolase
VKGAVTASSQEAADAGVEVLQQGGNAVDATVAAALASCVADPCNTGVGGYGGYMLVQRPGKAAQCIAFPLGPPSSMHHADLVRSCPESGPACSTVPSVVACLATALHQFGILPWSAVSGAAIRLARKGVVANKTTLRAFSLHRDQPFIAECFELEEDLAAGLVFRQPELAATLEQMSANSPQWFYSGLLADRALAAWRADGVNVALNDWKEHAASVFVEEAAHLLVDDVHIYAPPLGLSGSACMFAFVVAAARIACQGSLEQPQNLAALAAAMARVWQHRFSMPSRNDFSGIAIDAWIESALSYTGPSVCVAPATEHTAHLNAADRDGMLAALTFTHGPAWFGGRWAIPGTGVIMNAGMHNFARAGAVERGGHRYGVSNMCPTIAERDGGGARLTLGCPGARRIPSNVALALSRFFFGGAGLQAGVSSGRFHSESASCAHIEMERFGADVVSAFREMFIEVQPELSENYFGPLTAISCGERGPVNVAIDDRELPGFSACIH